jgi:hypothetical protein
VGTAHHLLLHELDHRDVLRKIEKRSNWQIFFKVVKKGRRQLSATAHPEVIGVDGGRTYTEVSGHVRDRILDD